MVLLQVRGGGTATDPAFRAAVTDVLGTVKATGEVTAVQDATVIRGVLLPAVMSLLGERNWYLPRWLRRLPDLTHDESATPRPPVASGHPAAPVPDHAYRV